jgi:hypothetical protein
MNGQLELTPVVSLGQVRALVLDHMVQVPTEGIIHNTDHWLFVKGQCKRNSKHS